MTDGSPPMPLHAVLESIRAQLGTDAGQCDTIAPRWDGTLQVRWVAQGASATMSVALDGWTRSGRTDAAPLGAEIVEHDGVAGDTLDDWRRRTLRVIASQWRSGLGVWAAPAFSRDRRIRASRDLYGLGRILGRKLAPGVVFWRGWRLDDLWTEASRARSGAWLQLADGRGGACRLFLGQGDGLQRLAEYPGWSYGRFGSGPAPDADPQLEQVVGFLLSRCLLPVIDWLPVPDSEDRGAEGELVANCNRGSFESYMRPSQYFSPWGYADTFGIAGAVERTEVIVFHASRECPMANQPLHRSLFNGVRPWSEELQLYMDDALRTYVTDTDDLSITMGGEDRLARLFDQLDPVRKGSGSDLTSLHFAHSG